MVRAISKKICGVGVSYLRHIGGNPLRPDSMESAKCELFRLFLLNCEQSSRNNLFEWSQFKRNRRNNSHFAKKKRSWNQAFTHYSDHEDYYIPMFPPHLCLHGYHFARKNHSVNLQSSKTDVREKLNIIFNA